MSDLERRLREFPREFPRPRDTSTRRTAERLAKIAPTLRSRSRGLSSIALLAAALGIGVFVGAVSSASGTDTSSVPGDPTIGARRYTLGKLPHLELSGRIPTTAAGEVVQILERRCGLEHFRIATDRQTVAGGFWSFTTLFFETATYVARWNGRLSDEITVRSALTAVVAPAGPRRWRVLVATRLQSMGGRPVVLQRRTSDDRWVRVRTARLRLGRNFGDYEATFSVPTRRLTLRVLVPQASARPCHDAAVSRSWRS